MYVRPDKRWLKEKHAVEAFMDNGVSRKGTSNEISSFEGKKWKRFKGKKNGRPGIAIGLRDWQMRM